MGNMSVESKGLKGQEVKPQHPLLAAFRDTIKEVWQLQSSDGRVNREASKVMTGFLTGATVALRVAGEKLWASRFETAARRLDQDWTTFGTVIQHLCADIDREVL